MPDRIVFNNMNTKLWVSKVWKKQGHQCTRTWYDSQEAYVLSVRNVEEKKQVAENRKKATKAKISAHELNKEDQYFFKISKDFIQLGPNLIYEFKLLFPSKITKSSDSSTWNNKRGN